MLIMTAREVLTTLSQIETDRGMIDRQDPVIARARATLRDLETISDIATLSANARVDLALRVMAQIDLTIG